MAWLFSSLAYVPFFVCSCVLGGFALWGWRRSGATGALIIAIAAGLEALHQVVGVYTMWHIWNRTTGDYALRLGIFSAAQSAGSFIANVLFIVGVALVLRRLPARR